jgi:hypothetical protein
MWFTLATWGANQAVFQADLDSGITLDGVIATIEFPSEDMQFRAGSYAGDLRVEYDGIVSTILKVKTMVLEQDRGQI